MINILAHAFVSKFHERWDTNRPGSGRSKHRSAMMTVLRLSLLLGSSPPLSAQLDSRCSTEPLPAQLAQEDVPTVDGVCWWRFLQGEEMQLGRRSGTAGGAGLSLGCLTACP